ncbi:hypothetical protein Tco_0826038, partial [Tanacetum coccineum]
MLSRLWMLWCRNGDDDASIWWLGGVLTEMKMTAWRSMMALCSSVDSWRINIDSSNGCLLKFEGCCWMLRSGGWNIDCFEWMVLIGGAHRLPGSIQGSGERRTNDGKRSQADVNLLCQPGAKGPGSKLHRHGKISASISTCKQKAKKILPSSPYH